MSGRITIDHFAGTNEDFLKTGPHGAYLNKQLLY